MILLTCRGMLETMAGAIRPSWMPMTRSHARCGHCTRDHRHRWLQSARRGAGRRTRAQAAGTAHAAAPGADAAAAVEPHLVLRRAGNRTPSYGRWWCLVHADHGDGDEGTGQQLLGPVVGGQDVGALDARQPAVVHACPGLSGRQRQRQRAEQHPHADDRPTAGAPGGGANASKPLRPSCAKSIPPCRGRTGARLLKQVFDILNFGSTPMHQGRTSPERSSDAGQITPR